MPQYVCMPLQYRETSGAIGINGQKVPSQNGNVDGIYGSGYHDYMIHSPCVLVLEAPFFAFKAFVIAFVGFDGGNLKGHLCRASIKLSIFTIFFFAPTNNITSQ